jgi:hypothetical protein
MGTLIFILALGGAGGAPILVYLADGSSLPLQSWTLSYEYVTWPRGGDVAYGQVARREESVLWLGKRRIEVAGAVLELQPGAAPRERVVLVRPGGRREQPRTEPPERDLVAPEVAKNKVVLVRSLDLLGETLTGTRRQFCLLSFSTLVECGGGPEQRVIRVEFPEKE